VIEELPTIKTVKRRRGMDRDMRKTAKRKDDQR
jgi:hypothetical protein